MRLEKIKLAGFKSFVDPTTLLLKSNLVGVVGPNGCGKSNLIDAVRWVMGESSAKHLRGDTMADVIFNGSSSRKPVGLASVELIFDNSEARAPGQYASYQEISIKRQVSRDGQSVYLLNGSRCRRKDIIDIFLGTGLGARSYAIIEQGTISRLVEARPDEFREIIEEAAGISKYKERRHETEIRMRHTQENLEKLQALRSELRKQLDHLQKQAQKAAQYVALKEEERRYHGELLALRWQQYDQRYRRQQAGIDELKRELDAVVVEQGWCNEGVEQAREQQQTLQQSLNAQQGRFYALATDISRLDQLIKHARKLNEERHRELARLRAENERLLLDYEQDRAQIEAFRTELATVEIEYRNAAAVEAQRLEDRIEIERSVTDGRKKCDQFKTDRAGFTQQREIQRTRIRQLEEQMRQGNATRQRLESERHEHEPVLADDALRGLTATVADLESTLEALRVDRKTLDRVIEERRAQVKDYREKLNRTRDEWHPLQGKVTSLELLQEHAIGKAVDLAQRLDSLDLGETRRLAEYLDVRPGWEAAAENVLNIHLQAVCLEDTSRIVPYLAELPEGAVAFFETRPGEERNDKRREAERLIDQIRSPWNLEALLAGIYCASDLAGAMALRPRLENGESVVTPDGVWLGPGWIVCRRKDDATAGVIQRERELRSLKERDAMLREQCLALEQGLSAAEQALRSADNDRQAVQDSESRISAELGRRKSALAVAKERREQAQRRLSQIDDELRERKGGQLQIAEELAEAAALLQAADRSLAAMAQEEQTLTDRLQNLQMRLRQAEAAHDAARSETHRLKSRLDTIQSSEAFALQQMERIKERCVQAGERVRTLQGQLAATRSLDRETGELTSLTTERLEVEQALAETRRRLDDGEAAIRSWSERRIELDRNRESRTEALDRLRLEQQAAATRRQTISEQMAELGVTPEQILAGLDHPADEQRWQEKLNELGESIAKLGAINLAAVDEYENQAERMEFLDQQQQDLGESLTTLHQAIEKIDRECKSRFKETFDRVNAGLKVTFSKLFGGGEAYLALDEGDLLATGVSLMARPPGKRNASIHLLSGGEKALTAVALVFAVFELNPAPFCLLDEVDAPLDDANVGRFGQLVKDMSETVQFLFVSHNKATMEIAEHLTGVTMKEPGVSRIVAVDIDEALKLAVA
jgi:chromosome segregation protein